MTLNQTLKGKGAKRELGGEGGRNPRDVADHGFPAKVHPDAGGETEGKKRVKENINKVRPKGRDDNLKGSQKNPSMQQPEGDTSMSKQKRKKASL